jgi:hypothetical protein
MERDGRSFVLFGGFLKLECRHLSVTLFMSILTHAFWNTAPGVSCTQPCNCLRLVTFANSAANGFYLNNAHRVHKITIAICDPSHMIRRWLDTEICGRRSVQCGDTVMVPWNVLLWMQQFRMRLYKPWWDALYWQLWTVPCVEERIRDDQRIIWYT